MTDKLYVHNLYNNRLPSLFQSRHSHISPSHLHVRDYTVTVETKRNNPNKKRTSSICIYKAYMRM